MTDGLYDLYKEKGWELETFFSILHKTEKILKCPCSTEKKCLHNILPSTGSIGGRFCANECPASIIWRKFKSEVKKAMHIHLYGWREL